jgi:hypothetical protein
MSTDTQSPNGVHAQPAAPAAVRVRFGPGPTEHMPIEWAEKLLRHIKETKPLVFGEAMLAVLDIDASVKERR